MLRREGDLDGLPAMIAGLIEGNLVAHPERGALLKGALKRVRITASDLDTTVFLTLGAGEVVVGDAAETKPDMWIWADAATLIDLPNAKLLGGLPSIADPIGRSVIGKLLSGKMKVKGIMKVGLLSKVQRLLSVT